MVGCAFPVLGVSFLLFIFKLGVAVIKLKNPPVNSLSLEVLTEFAISLEKLENDKTCRGVILTSWHAVGRWLPPEHRDLCPSPAPGRTVGRASVPCSRARTQGRAVNCLQGWPGARADW